VRGSDQPFRDFAAQWLATKANLRPRTIDGYRVGLDHAFARIGDLPLTAVTVEDIAGIVAEMQAEGYSGNTIICVLKPVRQVFARALRLGLVDTNPVHRLERNERPVPARAEMRILDRNEIALLLRHAPSDYRAPLATAIFTGLRCGELLGLQHEHLDLERQVVLVRQQADRDGSLQSLKTPHSRRDVLLTPGLTELLRQHQLESHDQRPEAFVFSRRTGRPMHAETLRQYGLRPAVTAAGLDRSRTQRLRLHDLRHTFASLLIAQGMSVAFVSRQMGHTNISTTLDIYTHLFDYAEHATMLIERLEHEFGALLISCSLGRMPA
jgi:integrase